MHSFRNVFNTRGRSGHVVLEQLFPDARALLTLSYNIP